MTKTEYQNYLASEHWRSLRKEFLSECGSYCTRCNLPRWLARLLYDQDLHAHHLHYRTLGQESFEDLEALCGRCHDVEHFGRSDLKAPKRIYCTLCGGPHWNPFSDFCHVCAETFYMPPGWSYHLHDVLYPEANPELTVWKYILSQLESAVSIDSLLSELATLDERRRQRASRL